MKRITKPIQWTISWQARLLRALEVWSFGCDWGVQHFGGCCVVADDRATHFGEAEYQRSAVNGPDNARTCLRHDRPMDLTMMRHKRRSHNRH